MDNINKIIIYDEDIKSYVETIEDETIFDPPYTIDLSCFSNIKVESDFQQGLLLITCSGVCFLASLEIICSKMLKQELLARIIVGLFAIFFSFLSMFYVKYDFIIGGCCMGLYIYFCVYTEPLK